MAFRVSISAKAKRDLNRILDWLLTQGAGDAGVQWWRGSQRAISSLENTPRRCALAPESDVSRAEVRHLLYGTKPHVYRILFTIKDEVVSIIHIRHGQRLPSTRQ